MIAGVLCALCGLSIKYCISARHHSTLRKERARTRKLLVRLTNDELREYLPRAANVSAARFDWVLKEMITRKMHLTPGEVLQREINQAMTARVNETLP